ncbi:MAG TPA: potassium-transporting ATPase subunit KdpA, partial [Waddliaceae bacterium]
AVVLVGEGVIQTFSSYVEVTTLENAKQTIPLGPVASQIAIKQLGTNGGGFLNANSAHPFENPTAFSNLLEMLALVLIPAASVYTFGIMIGSKKHAWLLFSAMFVLWVAGISISFSSEHLYNSVIDVYPILEGKETRLGTTNSLLWSVSTTATSNGSVNAMMSSLSPLAGGLAMFNIMLGELVFGGVGVGLCSIIMFTLLTVFLSGLMVGRTPEYLGKKIEKREMQWVMMAVMMPGALILIGAGISCVLPEALSSLGNQGPHGLSEILYAFTSSAGNNGSAFAGLNANTNYYNLALGTVMLLARISIILPSLAIAGLLAKKKITPPSAGTFSTNSILFVILLISVILIVGALTFFPALSLGPAIEHLLMLEGQSF